MCPISPISATHTAFPFSRHTQDTITNPPTDCTLLRQEIGFLGVLTWSTEVVEKRPVRSPGTSQMWALLSRALLNWEISMCRSGLANRHSRAWDMQAIEQMISQKEEKTGSRKHQENVHQRSCCFGFLISWLVSFAVLRLNPRPRAVRQALQGPLNAGQTEAPALALSLLNLCSDKVLLNFPDWP